MTTRTKGTASTIVRLPENFVDRATKNPAHAMAYMFRAAFGFTLSQALEEITKMVKDKNYNLIFLIFAAGVQVRGNVTAVGPDTFKIKANHQIFFLPGRPGAGDEYNFSALHITAHVIFHSCISNQWAKNSLNKAGSCITGEFADGNESEAAEINREIAKSWSDVEKKTVADWVTASRDTVDFLSKCLSKADVMADQFAKFLADGTAAPAGVAATIDAVALPGRRPGGSPATATVGAGTIATEGVD